MHGKQLHGSAYVVTEERRKKRFCFETTIKEEEAERTRLWIVGWPHEKIRFLSDTEGAVLYGFFFGFCIRLQLHMMAKGTLNTGGVWARVLAASNSNQICYALRYRVSSWFQSPYMPLKVNTRDGTILFWIFGISFSTHWHTYRPLLFYLDILTFAGFWLRIYTHTRTQTHAHATLSLTHKHTHSLLL